MNFDASLARKTMAPYSSEMCKFVRSPLVTTPYAYNQIFGLRQLEQREYERKRPRSYWKRTLPMGVSRSQASLSSGAPSRIVFVSFVRVYPGLGLCLVGQLSQELS
jgi:hypothetical protein